MKINQIINSAFNQYRGQIVNQQNNKETPSALRCKTFQNAMTSPVVFKSLKQTTGDENLMIDTAFYRDLPTLIGFSKLIKDQFPDGADIMDFACSNGEEAISVYTLLNDKKAHKYKIHCYDTSQKALKLAKNNIHAVNNYAVDSFLIENTQSDAIKSGIKSSFNEIMQEVDSPKKSIHCESFMAYVGCLKSFKEKYFKVKDSHLKNFSFQKGDIRDILKIQPEKQVGAVFFRNALYHLTNNYPFARVYDRPTLNKIRNTNKEEVLQKIVDNVYEKLLPGGFFVLGNDEKEHIYQADKYTPKEEIYFDDEMDEYLCLKSPLLKALRKDGKFKPVLSSTCRTLGMSDLTVYTVWQKVEK